MNTNQRRRFAITLGLTWSWIGIAACGYYLQWPRFFAQDLWLTLAAGLVLIATGILIAYLRSRRWLLPWLALQSTGNCIAVRSD